jgi:hypothetical protein
VLLKVRQTEVGAVAVSYDRFTAGYICALRLAHPEVGGAPFASGVLARIIEDCAAFGPKADELHLRPPEYGEAFWLGRQSGFESWSADVEDLKRRFPPLLAALDGQGEVRLGLASEAVSL